MVPTCPGVKVSCSLVKKPNDIDHLPYRLPSVLLMRDQLTRDMEYDVIFPLLFESVLKRTSLALKDYCPAVHKASSCYVLAVYFG